ncbi:ribonuclease E inhibitor RraB [Herbiconiux solani]|uniref:ribonuclease E inhibitor RraB n=1 Tax=Herbiconiux solani TaxID=661329 RepID=UPI000824E8E9|nr:ribonuclease E inhibitor RraB [Herbiconiux solani]
MHPREESRAAERADTADERAASVATILSELVELFREYELPQWARALEADRLRVLAGDEAVYGVLRSRLSARRGLSEVRVGFGDRALNARLDDLRERLRSQVAAQAAEQTPQTQPQTQTDLGPATYGERVEREPAPEHARVIFAGDYPRGTLMLDDAGRFLRSTWSVLEYDRKNRLRPFVRVWRSASPVSVEEYRSLRAACIGWWITLAALPALVVGAGVAGLRLDVWSVLVVIAAVLMPAAAVMVGVTERRRSKVVGLYSEKTGMLATPLSRGSRAHLAGRSAAAEPSRPGTPSPRAVEADERMLRRLRRLRASGKAFSWVVFFSCDDQLGAETIATAVVRDGWELRWAGPRPSGPGWGLIAERDVTSLESSDVGEARLSLETLAATVDGGRYEGWQVDE